MGRPASIREAPAPVGWPDAPSSAQPLIPAVPLATDGDGYLVLFDGANSAGWIQAGSGAFSIADGYARSQGGPGVWYFCGRVFGDFVLRLEFRQNELTSDSGVFLRIPRADGDPNAMIRDAYEIQIAGAVAGPTATGAIYGQQTATRVPLEAAGHWNRLAVTVRGQRYSVELNGQAINDFTGARSLVGMIGIQNRSKNDIVDFRNVRVKEL